MCINRIQSNPKGIPNILLTLQQTFYIRITEKTKRTNVIVTFSEIDEMTPDNTTHTSNFWFLTEFMLLKNIAESAEYYLYSEPAISLTKQRLFAEKATELLFSEHFIEHAHDDSLSNRLRILKRENVLNDVKITNCFYQIKNKGNDAVHEAKGDINDAISGLLNTYRVAKWLVEVYGEIDSPLPKGFKKPDNLDARHALNELQKQFNALQNDYQDKLKLIEEISREKTKEEHDNLKEKAYRVSTKIHLTEAETREIIDQQLRDAGWEADTKKLTYSKGTRPEKGRNIAISEWKVKDGWADYALFIGEKFYGVIEAKKKNKEVLSDLAQAKRYSKNALKKHGGEFLGIWNKYQVPFMFSTNSTLYHFMFENRSGTWFLDGRKSTNHPKALRNWFSPRDLKELFEKDVDKAIKDLEASDDKFLTDKKGLNLRPYQIEAVKATENAVATPDADRALLAMATGTGKTRTVLGICYRLLKSKRFKRILFLVDRTLLGEQAADSFKDTTIEGLQSFSKIFDIKEIDEIEPELDTKLHFATVQGMYRRIFDNLNPEKVPTVGTYDCIVIDEAHRGYNLDKQMDDVEVQFKDQSDFRSKYRQVIEYFDAFRIGLTATPAPHTISIFGRPVFEYTYPRAVVEGYLIGYAPPYLIKTELSEGGITWSKGETVKVYNRLTREINELEDIEDEINVDIGGFNRLVLTESFNKTVLKELSKHISPDGPDKTLIFAASDDHGSDVVKWLKEIYKEQGVSVDDDSIRKITGTVDKPPSAVKHFKNEKFPTIVVTVDLLTTGVDVPAICNLVFLRRVRSRILYEQMLGRATRLCPEIEKENFKIFDAVGVFKNLEDYTNMKPTVTSPKSGFEGLVNELDGIDKIEDEATKQLAQEKQIEQLLAKLNRKTRKITTEQEEDFQKLSGGISSDDFIKQIRDQDTDQSINYIREKKKLFQFLDSMLGVPKHQLISEHTDQHVETVRDYEVTYEANDYLKKFREYILENRNKMAALELICTRPKALTRDSLKELMLEMKLAGFDTTKLNTAWKKSKNEEIAADIIAYIRSLALGDPLVPHEERIKNAMKKVRGMKEWTRRQEQWLKHFENQLIKESILHKSDLDKGFFKFEGGGYARLNVLFENELDDVLENINDNLYGNIG